ncbi:transmembrane protein, putative (macronuclear) [Tetrahymena thermophila SB210]|uniref:Transmembrane protein, putative n=1 Tax=Tetrahymena thermophila (strain SB210) TaxID=312017 RepID=Q23DT7_TETTS|nr:transmembrane protein, putative [Tetrahymena thermophila SB210]EAR94661.2 transmembrane protein, putative [Tetrahymena thermophila SB210]|eukprot:XP_001014599.2 transmembrane protein, putative [Tetrahymena thermophila SB210]
MKKKFVQLLIFPLYFVIAFTQNLQYNACGIPGCINCQQNINVCLLCDNNLTYNRSIQLCERRQDQLPSTYFDLSSTNNNLSYCHPSCKSCSGSSPSNCLECWDGYRPVVDAENQFIQCVGCGINNCLRCNKQNICLKCQFGYFLDAQSNSCRKCQVQGCLDCSLNAQSCNKCIAPLVFNLANKACQNSNSICSNGYQSTTGCNQCHRACKSCFDSGEFSCYECNQGYFFNLKNQCISCNSNCQSCSEFPQNCKSCSKNFYLLGNRCVSQCGKGFYAEDQICKPCPPQCAECLNQTYCTSCLDNSQYKLLSKSCVLRCTESQYVQMTLADQQNWLNMQYSQINVSNLTCNQCSSTCKTCILQSNRCTSCQQGYILFQNKCLRNCPAQYYQSIGENQQPICQKCPYPCIECTSSNFCLSCQSGFSLWQNGVCGYDYQVVGQCSMDQYQFQQICFDQCPQGSLVIGRRCLCQNGCSSCTYTQISNSISCTQCLFARYYTYQEQCVEICPPLTFVQESPSKACTNFCSGTQVRQILLKGRFCSDSCDQGTTNTQGVCNSVQCDKGQYFDNAKYQNQLKITQNIKNLLQFCMPCHPACLTCTGPSQYECITCKQQIFVAPGPLVMCPLNCSDKTQSILIQALPNSSTKQIICVQCQKGYGPQNVTNFNNILQTTCVQSIQCLKDQAKILVQNSQGSYEYVCKQQIACPTYTQQNYDTGQCDLISKLFTFQLDNNKQILQKYTVQDSLNYQFKSNINTLILINSIYLNDNKICCDQTVSTTDFNSQILPSNYPSIQYNNQLSFNLQIGKMNFVSVYNFQTLQIINGTFNISPQSGLAGVDNFTVTVNDFLIDGLQFQDYTLKYQIFMQYFENDCLNYQNFTLFLIDQNYLQQNQNPISLQFQFQFPYIQCGQLTRVYLKVFNDLVSTTTYVDINLEQQQQQPFQISPILNYTINSLKIPQDTSQQQWIGVIFVQKLILNNIIQPVDLVSTNTQNLNLLKILSNTPYFQMNCQNACTSNGFCIQDTKSYFQRCNCNQGFQGESCQWRQQDLEYLSTQFDNILGNYVSEFYLIIQSQVFDSNRFITALNTLNYIASFRDYFDQIRLQNFIQIMNGTDIYQCLSIYKTQASFNQLISASETLLNIFDKVFDLFKKLRIQNQNISEQIISNVQNVLLYIRQSLSLKDQNYQYQFAQTSITASIYLLGNKYQTPPIIITKDQSYQILLSDPFFNQLGDQDISIQVLAFPFIQEIQIQDPSKITIPSSKIIDIAMFKKIDSTSQQINISFPMQINISSYAYLFHIGPGQDGQIFLTACGYNKQSKNFDNKYQIDNNQTSASMQNTTCQPKNSQRTAIFFGNNFNTPNNNSGDNDKNKKDDNNDDDNEIRQPKLILTLINSLVIFGVSFIVSCIVSKVKQLEVTQMSDSQISGLKEDDNNKKADMKDSPSLPENPIIQEGVNVIAIGEILEENKIQRKGKSKIINLPINSIELFRRSSVNQQEERKIEQDDFSQFQNQKIEIILSQENIMRQVGQIPPDFRQQSFMNLNVSNMIQNQDRQQQKSVSKDINIIQIEEQKEKFSAEIDNLPKGIPIESPQIKANKIERDKNTMNNRIALYDYFSLKSFTKHLQNTPAHIRVFVFFSQVALIQFMVISFLLKVNLLDYQDQKKQDSQSFAMTLLYSIALKNLIQYLFPIIYKLLSKIELYFRQTNSFFYKNFVKGLYINIISLVIVFAIHKAANKLTNSQVSNFVIIYFVAVIIDMVVLDLVVLFIQKQIKNSKLIENSLMYKNYNFKLEA